MKTYESIARFNPSTGNPDVPLNREQGFLCDYCGEESKVRFGELHIPRIAYSYHYGGDDIRCLLEKYTMEGYPNLDIVKLMVRNPEFHFCEKNEFGGKDCEPVMLKEWFEVGGYLSGEERFAGVLIKCRLRTVKKHLDKKKPYSFFDLIDARTCQRIAKRYIQGLRDGNPNEATPECCSCGKATLVPSDIDSISKVGMCGYCAVVPRRVVDGSSFSRPTRMDD